MKVILLPICLLVCVAICVGQSNKPKPDFSGTWVDTKKSKDGSREQLQITHHDPELIIRRQVNINGVPEERDMTYYTDGRGEKNQPLVWVISAPGSGPPSSVPSETTWSKDKIVIRFGNRVYAGERAVLAVELTVEYRLSKDGQTMTRTTKYAPIQIVSAGASLPVGSGTETWTVYKLISK